MRINIAAAELRLAGIDPHAEPPQYKVWVTDKQSIRVRFYT